MILSRRRVDFCLLAPLGPFVQFVGSLQPSRRERSGFSLCISFAAPDRERPSASSDIPTPGGAGWTAPAWTRVQAGVFLCPLGWKWILAWNPVPGYDGGRLRSRAKKRRRRHGRIHLRRRESDNGCKGRKTQPLRMPPIVAASTGRPLGDRLAQHRADALAVSPNRPGMPMAQRVKSLCEWASVALRQH